MGCSGEPRAGGAAVTGEYAGSEEPRPSEWEAGQSVGEKQTAGKGGPELGSVPQRGNAPATVRAGRKTPLR